MKTTATTRSLSMNKIEVECVNFKDILSGSVAAKYYRYADHFDKYLKGEALPYASDVADILDAQNKLG